MTTDKKIEIVDQVKSMRDELRLKSHLLKMDAKDKWNELEGQYSKVVGKVEKATGTLGSMTDDVWDANKLAFKKLKEGYEQLKSDLK